MYTDSHPIQTLINTGGGHSQHCVHIQVTAELLFCHPLINKGKIQIRIFVFLTRDEQNEPCATPICLFLDSIDLCRSTANVH